ncbi:MAG: hypothetical protein AXW17_01750 [Colwellia sp. Phe_37]|nr:MAG: hypothetical protein AXW17_01750 [Colwellia sp. Phe_37]
MCYNFALYLGKVLLLFKQQREVENVISNTIITDWASDMNISQRQKNQQINEDELDCITMERRSHNDKSDVVATEVLLEKVLTLLDDSTPNYILGYN